CDVLLALIGPGWLDARDASGQRRLDNPLDFVRLEIEAALRRNIRVIPVLLDGAGLPHEDSLPAALQPLTRRQALRITHERLAADAEGLLRSLAAVVEPTSRSAAAATSSHTEQARRPPGFALSFLAALFAVFAPLVGLVGAWGLTYDADVPDIAAIFSSVPALLAVAVGLCICWARGLGLTEDELRCYWFGGVLPLAAATFMALSKAFEV